MARKRENSRRQFAILGDARRNGRLDLATEMTVETAAVAEMAEAVVTPTVVAPTVVTPMMVTPMMAETEVERHARVRPVAAVVKRIGIVSVDWRAINVSGGWGRDVNSLGLLNVGNRR